MLLQTETGEVRCVGNSAAERVKFNINSAQKIIRKRFFFQNSGNKLYYKVNFVKFETILFEKLVIHAGKTLRQFNHAGRT